MRICCYVCGAAGLIYAFVWTRKFSTLFGFTTLTVEMCVASFLAGLAGGGIVSGRLAPAWRFPAYLFGVAMVALGVYGAISLPLADGIGWLQLLLHRLLHFGAFLDSLTRALFILLEIAPAAVLLGAVVPLLTVASRAAEPGLGVRVGCLYTRCALGAAAGAVILAFVLLPYCGLLISTLLTSAIMTVAGLAMMILFESVEAPAAGADAELNVFAAQDLRFAFLGSRAAEFAVALTGFCSLFYLVTWVRSLELILSDSVWAMGVLLGTYCLGVGIGSAAAGVVIRRLPLPAAVLFLIQPLSAILAVAGAVLLTALPRWYIWLDYSIGDSPVLFALAMSLLCAPVLLLPAIANGMGLPLALDATRTTNPVTDAEWTGRLYGLHAAGAAGGAIMAALAIPLWGIGASFMVAVLVNLAAAAAVALGVIDRLSPARWIAIGATVLVGILLFAAVPRWRTDELMGGVYFYAPEVARAGGFDSYRARVAAGKAMSYAEGRDETVSVRQFPRGNVLSINGFAEGSRTSAAHVLLGHLPFLLSPSMKRVFVIGFSTGVVAGSAALHPVAAVDVAESEPAVVEAAALFEEVNESALSDSRIHVLAMDPRVALAAAEPASYDLIVNQPSDIWSPSGARLYTTDFYRLAASRLGSAGVMAQWLPLNRLDFTGLRSAIASFTHVFPKTLVVLVSRNSGELLLLGAGSGPAVDWDRLNRLFSADPGARDLARVGWLNAGTALERILLGPRELDRLTAGARFATSDNGLLEFHALSSEHRETQGDNLRRLYLLACDPWAYTSGAPEGAAREPRLREMAASAREAGDLDRGIQFARQAQELAPSYEGYLILGDLLLKKGSNEEGVEAWNKALAIHPEDPAVLSRLVRFYEPAGPAGRPKDYTHWVAQLPPAYRPRPGQAARVAPEP